MTALEEKIRKILADTQLALFATVTSEGKPWVRYVMARGGEDLSIRFATFLGSRKVAQVKGNPEVHMTLGVTSLETAKDYLQIQARAEVSTGEKERKAFWRDELKAYFKGVDDPEYAIVIVRPYRIEFMAMGSMEPEVWEA